MLAFSKLAGYSSQLSGKQLTLASRLLARANGLARLANHKYFPWRNAIVTGSRKDAGRKQILTLYFHSNV